MLISKAESQWRNAKTITHAAGHKVELKAKPERIAILHAMYLDYFLALETKPAASAGVTDALKQFETLEPYKTTTGIIDLGNARELSVEAVLAAKPDVIVTFKGHIDKIYDSLIKIAPVIQMDYSGRWQDSLLLCAKLTGKEALAEQYIKDTEALIAKTREQLDKQGSKTFALLRTSGKGEFMALGSGNTLYYNKTDGFGLTIPQDYPKDSQMLSLDALSKMNCCRICWPRRGCWMCSVWAMTRPTAWGRRTGSGKVCWLRRWRWRRPPLQSAAASALWD
jgi:iron complex transport system substrate-binding protein